MYTSIASISFDAQGSTWNVDFEVEGAASANNHFFLRSPTVRKRGKEKLNPFNPVIPTVLSTKVWDESRTLHDKIENNQNDSIAITVTKDGTIWHTGLLDRVSGGDQINRDNPELDLVWNDSLPSLKGITWENEQGRITLLELYWYLTQATPANLDVRAALEVVHSNHDTSSGVTRSWLHDLLHQGSGLSYWDVLVQTLAEYNMQIFQYAGRWQIAHRSARGGSYSWEQRDAGGTETTGTTSPVTTLTGANFVGEPRRPQIAPLSWAQSFTFDAPVWLNPRFKDTYTEAISGNTVPKGFELEGLTFDSSGEQLKATAAFTQSDTAEQIVGPVLVHDGDDTADVITIGANGEIDVQDTGSTNDISVQVLRVSLITLSGTSTRYLTTAGSLSTTKQTIDVTVQESNSGAQTRSWSVLFENVSPPALAGEQEWYVLVEAVSPDDADVDGDVDPELAEVRWDFIEVREYEQNVTGDRGAWDSVTYSLDIGDKSETENTNIGSAQGLANTQFGDLQDVMTAHNGIRYLDSTSGEFELAQDPVDHSSRSYSGQLGRFRLLDRYAQHSRNIFRLLGEVDRAAIDFVDTIDYKSTQWIPHFERTAIKQAKKEIGGIVLRDDDTSGITVTVKKG